MKNLWNLHIEAALTAPEPLVVEQAITDVHRAETDPIRRELAVLSRQFPAQFRPIEPGDLLAGRVRYPLVSFGPEPAGLGYACLADEIRRVVIERQLDSELRQRAEAMIRYWDARTTGARTRAAFPQALAAALPSDAWLDEPGAAFPLYRLAGTVLDYARLLQLGLPGLCAEIDGRLQQVQAPAQRSFLEGVREALSLVQGVALRYAAEARARAADHSGVESRECLAIAEGCEAAARRAPQTFHEAMQLAWLYALCAGTWNYGRVDDWLGDFLERDLKAGRIDEARALDLICAWWRLMCDYANQFNNRVIIGGRGRRNERAADRFARLAIAATRRLRLNQPQLTLRFHADQNPALMSDALDAIAEGCTFPLLYNDDVNVPAVAPAFGVGMDEAVQYTPFGCGEYVIAHRSVGTPSGIINLAQCLALALHAGRDPASGRQAGPATGNPGDFADFEALWRAYTAQVEYAIAALAEQQKLEYDVVGAEAPFLLLSALYDDCLARGRPLLDGGVRHLGGTVETYGNTNTADALFAIGRVVFEEHGATLPELVAALDGDFAGEAEQLRQRLLDVPKYGNDDDAADAMAIRVHEHVCACAQRQAARVGLASYLVVIINNSANTALGHQTGATADGRRAGQPLANGNNPAPGADRSGPTALLNSLVKLDPRIHAGAVQNMKFGPALFRRERAKLEAMLAGYWRAGGTQAMITVVSREDLEAALREPEKWGHLMVRVGGFSIRFVELPRDVQIEILSRTGYE